EINKKRSPKEIRDLLFFLLKRFNLSNWYVDLSDGKNSYSVFLSRAELKGNVVILLHSIPVHGTTKRFVSIWQAFGKKRIVILGVHFGLEFEGGIKIVQIVKFTQMADKFQ